MPRAMLPVPCRYGELLLYDAIRDRTASATDWHVPTGKEVWSSVPTAKKDATIQELTEMLSRATMTVVTDYRGLKVPDLQAFRTTLRPLRAEARVAKNTLAIRAAANAGVPALEQYLAGPTMLVVSYDDPVAVAKAVGDFARTSRILQVRGGLTGTRPVSAEEVAAIATLPSRDVLVGRVVGQLQAPLYGLVGVLSGAIRQFAYVLQARIEQLGGAAAEAPVGDATPA